MATVVNGTNVLVYHIRNQQRAPIATLVATGPNNIGVAICNPKEQPTKELSLRIAFGRATVRNEGIGAVKQEIVETCKRSYKDVSGRKLQLAESILHSIDIMSERAKKYFK